MPELVLSFECKEESLSVRRFAAHESLSGLFDVSVWARSRNEDLDLEAIVGKPAALRVAGGVRGAHRSDRAWSGLCSFIEQTQAEPKGLSTYYLRIVPSLWRLSRRRGHRLFQHKRIPEIVDSLLGEWGIEPVWKKKPECPKLELRTQYGETDLAFLSRLLEEAGIAYFFDDKDGATQLVLTDEPQAAEARAGDPIPWVDNPSQAAELELVTRLHIAHDVRPGKLTMRDFDFRRPDHELTGEGKPAAAPEDKYELFHYVPGAFLMDEGKGGDTPVADDKGTARHDEKTGKALAEAALVAERTGKRRATFETNALDLCPGTVFSVDHHPRSDLAPDKRLLVTELRITGTPGGEWSAAGAAVFAAEPYRPARVTPKPRPRGVQSALVVGPKGQEIFTDELGRVRVQFPWDREGTKDDGSSCWMRVSQGWAGAAYGMIAIPRVGQEVLVGFVEGDPDQPVVVGRVFNQTAPVPYKLPANKTISTWRSATSPGSGGYNEIAFEDAKGKELVYIQAERDLDKLVKNDEIERTLKNHSKTVCGNQDLVVKKVKREAVLEDSHLHVQKDLRAKVDGTQSLIVGKDLHEKVNGRCALEAGSEVHVKAGDKIVIEAGASITLKAPGGFVMIDSSGVVIKGTLVRINSGGSAEKGGGCEPEAAEDAKEAEIEAPGTKT